MFGHSSARQCGSVRWRYFDTRREDWAALFCGVGAKFFVFEGGIVGGEIWKKGERLCVFGGGLCAQVCVFGGGLCAQVRTVVRGGVFYSVIIFYL